MNILAHFRFTQLELERERERKFFPILYSINPTGTKTGGPVLGSNLLLCFDTNEAGDGMPLVGWPRPYDKETN